MKQRSWAAGPSTEPNAGISRAGFLAATAAGIGGSLLAAPAASARADSRASAPAGGRRGVKRRGVCYTVSAGETPGTAWSAARMRADMRAIARALHADAVQVTGDGVERLQATATQAAESGLHVWLQPTLGDRPVPEILDHLAETGRHAERMRRNGAGVDLSIGCEFWLFVPGIVPGDNATERIQNLLAGNYDAAEVQRKLTAFISRAAAVGRSVFHGRLSYAAAQDDEVDWSLFDIVGIDYYSFFRRRRDYVRELSQYLRWGKPLAICEFGTCAYRGAPEQGGMAWDVVDYDKQPPELVRPLVRSERTQADYLIQLLDVFESMGLYAAMAFEFVTPEAPHRREPRYDLDLASYSIVKTIKDDPDDPASDWHWEPKQSFHALARAYRRPRCP